MPKDAFALTGMSWRHRFSFQRSLAELLGKRWMEAVVPCLLLVGVLTYFSITTEGFFTPDNASTLSQNFAELGLVALGMTIVLIGGGIDLSVGSVFAVVNGFALIGYKLLGWPVAVVAVAAIALGALLGSVNGLLIAYAKTRPFITTLVTLLAYRTVAEYIDATYSPELTTTTRIDPAWDMLGAGQIAGLTTQFVWLIVVAMVVHVLLSRSRWGWRITAIGSSRTSARRAGMNLPGITFSTYAAAGALAGAAGLLTASRLEQSSASTGVGMEFAVLTAVVLGGVSLAGGRGTAMRALIGALAVVAISQGLTLQAQPRYVYSMVLAVILLLFAAFDLKWGKNRGKAIQKIYMAPGRFRLKASPDIYEKGSVWALNDRLTGAEAIGTGELDGPEDVVVDDQGRMYCGDRRGWLWRIDDPAAKPELVARIGGHPLGVVMDAGGDVAICVAGMGLYGISPQGEVKPLATDVKRTWYRINDDSAIRLADDLDMAPDGKIYFSDASTRFDGDEYFLDLIESRPNGRLLCYDPKTRQTSVALRNYAFPNGICVSHDGMSVLINSSNLYRIDRFYIAGPKAGRLEPFIENLPGIPDNINRASDGGYWVAFAGMRTPVWDLAISMPKFRRRMVKELPFDEWLVPNLNTSCVIKITEEGEVVESMWDGQQKDHAVITSMREHEGYLYLGGLTNDRLGRVRLTAQERNGARRHARAVSTP
ncbi:SMP-30/gluconolactonase/LRE family protein [Streptosporangium sp. NBC_01755]|uniref:ABC transporter permease n=1 Tax=unclassified Streptosporangium TaxID=2632669 RepID=UPI002DD91D5F|nr:MULTISPECIES: SMP-30/gluconolactonase/LRE family protein [unclassified Streptosporangium]WSA28292.1 SMP-30/gluconolactonase/LRE family protein [Streptosporangium sp. NBC_01810]WSD00231.1 SMP-30/gluconolactonase/LRE family protein [Streptosporangium sp. NBC_01755]